MLDWINHLGHVLTRNRMTDGTSQSMRLSGDWPWPIWVTVVVVLVVLFLAYQLYKRTRSDLSWGKRHLLFALRCASLAIVFLMLAQWVLVTEQVGMPVLPVIIDDSMSMQIEDVSPLPGNSQRKKESDNPIKTKRWDQAIDLLCDHPALLNELAQKYRVRVYFLDGNVTLQEPTQELEDLLKTAKPERATTPLGRTIHQVMDGLRGQPPAGLVIFSDGVINEGPGLEDAARRAGQESIPLYFVGLGAEKGSPDLSVQSWVMEDTVFLGDQVALQAQLLAKNVVVKEAQLRLTDVTNQRVLAEEKIALSGETTDFNMTFRAEQPGEIELRLECLPIPDEGDVRNNSIGRRISVKKDTIRILMVDEAPRFEYRFLRNALIREPSFELTTVLFGADPEYVEEMKGALLAVPSSQDELWSYDVIILGDIAPNRLSSSTWQDIAAFVGDKDPPGGVIVISGPNFMPHQYTQSPLAKILPCTVRASSGDVSTEFGPRKVVPTREGMTMPWMTFGPLAKETEQIWRSLSSVYWFQPIIDTKPGARILAECFKENRPQDRPEPVVAFQYVGAGRVLFHATDETWRWRRLGGLSWYHHYWIEAVRFMARGKLESSKTPRLVTDRSEYKTEDPIRIMLECRNPSGLPLRQGSVSIWLEYEGQTRREIVLQQHPLRADLFETTLRGLAPGQYYVWVPVTSGETPSSAFTVLPPLKEWESVQMARKEMETAARLSGGAFYLPNEARQLLKDLPQGRGTLIETLPPRTLWNSSFVLLLLVVILSTEWLLRKRFGLL